MIDMRKAALLALFLASVSGSEQAAGNAISGSPTLESMTKRILEICPQRGLVTSNDLVGVSFVGGGSGVGENAMKVGTQQVAPMARFFNANAASPACGGNQSKAEGLQIAVDGIGILTSAAASTQCQGHTAQGGLARTTRIQVEDPPGANTTYRFVDWKDVLRTLYAGRDNTRPNGVAAACNSNVRRALQRNWLKIFEKTCGTTPCTELKHLWASGSDAMTTDTFLVLLGLPPVGRDASGRAVSTPICSGLDYEDKDPIRIPCDTNDDVCGADGTLGLVQTLVVPEGLPHDVTYPTRPCEPGTYDWAPAPSATLEACPGGGLNVFGLCLMPGFGDPGQPTGVNHRCLKREADDAPFFTPNTTNTLAYNQYLRNQNGSFVLDAQNREVAGAWYRIRSRAVSGLATGCRASTTTRQIGCLASRYNCTLGFAGREAEELGSVMLSIGGYESSAATMLAGLYPLSRPLYFNSLKGFEAVTNSAGGTITNELNLARCFTDSATVGFAATLAGLVPMNALHADLQPKCQDFDETVCGSATNANACVGNPSPFPKSCGAADCVSPQVCIETNDSGTAPEAGGRPRCVTPPLPRPCGDGVKEGNEECDDGNSNSGDGCSRVCQAEACGNNRVDHAEACDPPNGITCDAQCSAMRICGNGVQEVYEECDDGNSKSGDGCNNYCQTEACGNNRVDMGEMCDPPNGITCNAQCRSL